MSADQQDLGSMSLNSSFDYDTDYFGNENNMNDKEDDALSWRLDPSESHSDWKVVIKCPNGSEKEYHVHKNILAVGPSKSDYFSSLFRNSNHLRESETNTSTITLEESAAQVFPALLDFMYHKNNSLVFTRKNAVALRYLSQYFGIRLLHTKVMKFIRDDMNLDSVYTYISEAAIYHDERMLSLAADKIAQNIDRVKKSSPLLAAIDPHFFLRVVSSTEIDTCIESTHLSVLIGEYCSLHKDEIEEEMFEQITSKKSIPLIHPDAAMPLLAIEAVTCKKSDADSPSCLQKRCTKVLALNWKDLGSQRDACRNLPSSVLTDILDRSLSMAKQSCEEDAKMRDTEARRSLVECQNKLTALEVSFDQQSKQLEKVQKDNGEKIEKLKSIVAERDRQMSELEKELRKFVRLPVTHSFGPVSKSTYHHLSRNEPFDSATNEYNKYGRHRPTSVPCFGDSTENGYLYRVQKSSGYENWPVYYYKDD